MIYNDNDSNNTNNDNNNNNSTNTTTDNNHNEQQTVKSHMPKQYLMPCQHAAKTVRLNSQPTTFMI